MWYHFKTIYQIEKYKYLEFIINTEFFRYITNNLLNCASSRLHTLPIIDARFTRLSTLSIIDTRLTCMCIDASLPSSIDHLRAFVLLQIPFCTSVFAQKSFNKVKNDHEHTQRCEFLVLDQKHPFWANFTQQIKIVSLSWNLVSRPVRPYRIQSWCFFCFRPKIPFLV